jgi:hypothetical protein
MGVPALKNSQGSGLQVDRKDMGRADTLRFNVISFVVEENYDRAVKELEDYISRDSQYPRFKERVERYVGHCIDLVNAIRAKRKFPGMNHLTMAKQQEINEKYREHFNELQFVLRKIEQVHVTVKLDDVRSTVWVVRALAQAVGVIFLVGLLIELGDGLFITAITVIDDFFIDITQWIFRQF